MKTLISTFILGFVVILSSCRSGRDIAEPEFRDISNVRLIKVGLLQTTAGADMIFYNPNNSGIQLARARGDVYIDGSYLGHFELDEKVQVRRHAEFIVPVIFKLDNIGAIANQHDIFKKKEAMVRIQGYALLKKSGFSKEIPIRYEQMQDVDRLRAIVSR